MRPVCVLCRLGSREMAWFGRAVLHPAWAWIWRRLGLLWRVLTRLCLRALGLVTRVPLPAPEERGARDPEEDGGAPEAAEADDEAPEAAEADYRATEAAEADYRATEAAEADYGAPDAAEANGAPEAEEADGAPEAEEADGAPEAEEADGAPEAEEAASNGAAVMKRAAASQGDVASKRPKYEEEEYGGVDSDDEFYCDYDSTWEDEGEERLRGGPTPRKSPRSYNFRNFERAARDMQNFRHGYPNQNRGRHWSSNTPDRMPNLMFYLGREAAQPDGFSISEFYSEWSGRYGALERVHTFIQWLFPLQEPGMNHQARPLTPLEVEKFRESDVAKENLLKSYQLMLDFYGIELRDEKTGEVRRSPNWKDRFDNLNRNTHNNLRITRILKCLGTLGFQHYQVPLVRFFLEETLVKGELPRVKESVLNYFVFAVLDRRERRKLIRFAFSKYDDRDEFVWCPKKIQTRWLQNERNVQGGARHFVPSLVFRPNTEVQDDGDEPESLY